MAALFLLERQRGIALLGSSVGGLLLLNLVHHVRAARASRSAATSAASSAARRPGSSCPGFGRGPPGLRAARRCRAWAASAALIVGAVVVGVARRADARSGPELADPLDERGDQAGSTRRCRPGGRPRRWSARSGSGSRRSRRRRPRPRAGGSRCRCRRGWRRGTGAGCPASTRESRVSRSTRAGRADGAGVHDPDRRALAEPRRRARRRRAGAVVGGAGVDGERDVRAAPATAATRAPRRPTSSCTVAVATTSRRRGPGGPQRLDHHEHADAVVEALRASPGRRCARAGGCAWPCRRAAPARAPLGRQAEVDRQVGHLQVLAAVLRVDQVDRASCRRPPPGPRARAPAPAGRPASGRPSRRWG